MIAFYLFGAIAVFASLLVVTQHNPLYSVLLLITSFGALSGLYVLLDAPFVAVIQIIVYAGAIMVLFLFVIMLLGAEKTGVRMLRSWQTPLAIGLAVLVVGLGALLLLSTAPIKVVDRPTAEIVLGSAEAIGLALYSVWLFPFEAVSILLLVAMIGAVVMTRQEARQEARDERKKKTA